MQPEDVAGLVTIWNENGPAIQFWRSMFEKKAPTFIEPVQEKMGKDISQGNTIHDFDDQLLALLTEAHRAARVQPSVSI